MDIETIISETTITDTNNGDTRTPSPPYGYSRECTHSREQQIHIVAEFHAHKIRPSRIAYRVGIDIALIEELIAGEVEAAPWDDRTSKPQRESDGVTSVHTMMTMVGARSRERDPCMDTRFI